jgi:hypothetical protein
MCDQVPLNQITVFQEKECVGNVQIFSNSGSFSVKNIKSIVIPENFKVTLVKKSHKLEFDQQLWGTYIDDTQTHIDKWKDSSEETHMDFDDIDTIIIDKFTERSTLLASSCVGLLEPPIIGYEPTQNGNLNLECDHFLDVYCSGSDNYSKELCQHRQVCVTSHSSQSNNATIILVIVGIIVIVTFCYIVYISQFGKNSRRLPYIEEVE